MIVCVLLKGPQRRSPGQVEHPIAAEEKLPLDVTALRLAVFVRELRRIRGSPFVLRNVLRTQFSKVLEILKFSNEFSNEFFNRFNIFVFF